MQDGAEAEDLDAEGEVGAEDGADEGTADAKPEGDATA
jgi:hypothetical protein